MQLTQLKQKIEILEKKVSILEITLNEQFPNWHKVNIATSESLSLLDDVEFCKTKINELEAKLNNENRLQ